jgi:hypothetical protein
VSRWRVISISKWKRRINLGVNIARRPVEYRRVLTRYLLANGLVSLLICELVITTPYKCFMRNLEAQCLNVGANSLKLPVVLSSWDGSMPFSAF